MGALCDKPEHNFISAKFRRVTIISRRASCIKVLG